MTTPVTGVPYSQQTAQTETAPTVQPKQPSQQKDKQTTFPQDTVTISPAGQAASKAYAVQGQTSAGDTDHDGDSK